MQNGGYGDEQGGFSRDRLLFLVLGIATLLALYLCYLIVSPFIPAIAVAGAVAIATKEGYKQFRNRLGKNVAAGLMVLLVACLIFVPLVLLVSYIVRQIIAGVHQLQQSGGLTEWRTIVEIPPAVRRALDWAEANLNLQAGLQRLGQILVGQAGGLLTGSISALTQIVFVLFVLFFFYRDGEIAIRGLRRMVPLSDEEANRMFRRIEDTILAIVNGSLTVAFVQATLAGIMYTVLGVPAPVIWAAVTFVAALLPLGTVMVWGPISIFLLLSGNWVKALILVGWGALAVGTIDNILYPYLVGGRLRLHTLPTFFAVVGGITVFGPAGIILGPVVLAVTIGMLEVWQQRTADGRTAEHPVDAASRLTFPGGEEKSGDTKI